MKYCEAYPEEQKKTIFQELVAEKEKTGTERSTHVLVLAVRKAPDKMDIDNKNVAGRLKTPDKTTSTTLFMVTATDSTESMTEKCRTDDASDEEIVSSKFAERAVINGIGKIAKIDKVILQVALKKKNTGSAQSFKLSRSWTPPRTVLRLSVGPIDL